MHTVTTPSEHPFDARALRGVHAVVAVSSLLVIGACNNKSAPAPAPAAKAAAAAPAAPAPAPKAAPAKPAKPAPKAVTGHPNLPGFVRPTAPVAVVNGKPIPAARFNAEFDRLVGSGVRIPADRLKTIARNILGRLIEDELRTQAIIRDRIELTEAEFETAWAEHMARYKDADGTLDKAQFDSHLKRNNMSVDDLKQKIRRERLARKLVEKRGDIAVDRDEIKAFYDNNASAWIEKESRDVRPILIEVKPDAPETAWEEAKTKAQETFAALSKGGDFETIAKKSGDVPRAPIHLNRTSTEQALAHVAFKQKVGEVSAPIKTKWGYFVVRLIAKNDERTRTFLEVKEEIRTRIRDRKIYLEGQRLLREMRKNSEVTEKLPF